LTNSFRIDLERGQVREGMMVVSWFHADKMDLDPGDLIEIEVPRFDPETGFKMETVEIRVSGVHSNHLGSIAFIPLATMQNITGLHGMINAAYVNTISGEDDRDFENDLITRDGISSVTYIDERKGLLDQYLDIFIGTVAVMAFISVILAGAIVYTMFRISAREQERDYATMKTLGTTLGKIAKLIFQEGTYITILGIGLGVLGGYGLSFYMLHQNEEWESFGMTTQFSWPAFFVGSILIIFVVVIVSFLTLRYISRINIANVIRERAAG
jgi:putative ABC transport system permease protein